MSIDTKAFRDVDRTGRYELIQRIRALCDELDEAKQGLLLVGWFCRACGVFNGESKWKRESCRACDAPNGGRFSRR
jgi:hypothetical protein